MNLESTRIYCLKKKGVTESFPFDEETLVFKVMNKMFCLTTLTPPHWINLKCDPEKAIEHREEYESVTPGYHMNKKFWITVQLDGSVPSKVLQKWIDESYELVVANFPQKMKNELFKLK
ncbi:MAG: MmcQ-like protein [Flavobacterium sp.]|nr:MmcQ-like protein [Flavobacterium sp.]